MKRLFILFLLVTHITQAQETTELFTVGNNFYKEGKYDQAIDFYKKIIERGNISSELYYNLGNCYYKLNKVAPSIYNYEVALKLNNTNIDAKNNLVFANRLTIDRIKPLPKNFLQQINKGFLKQLSFENWGRLTILCSILVAVFFISFYYSYNSNKKKLFFTGSITCFTLLLITLYISFQQKNQFDKTFAIIFSKEIKVYNEPVNDSDSSFTLHEGTKVKVLDMVDNWKKIKIINGKIGWILSKDLKEI